MKKFRLPALLLSMLLATLTVSYASAADRLPAAIAMANPTVSAADYMLSYHDGTPLAWGNPARIAWNGATGQLTVTYPRKYNHFALADTGEAQASKLYKHDGKGNFQEVVGVTAKIAATADARGEATYGTVVLAFYNGATPYAFDKDAYYAVLFDILADGHHHGTIKDGGPFVFIGAGEAPKPVEMATTQAVTRQPAAITPEPAEPAATQASTAQPAAITPEPAEGGDVNGDKNAGPWIGLWRYKGGNGITVFHFKKDGTFSALGHYTDGTADYNMTGKYAVADGKVTFTDVFMGGQAYQDITLKFRVNGDTAVVDATELSRVPAKDMEAVLANPFAP